jgi:hypothetical protein
LLLRQVHRAIDERLWLARRNHRLALDFLAIGALPFAIATWWSVVTPLIAALALVTGRRSERQHALSASLTHA